MKIKTLSLRTFSSKFLAASLGLAFAGITTSALAQDTVTAAISGAGGTFNWGDNANWLDGSFPNATDASVAISGTFSANLSLDIQDTSDVNQTYTVGDLSFQDTASTFRDLALQNGTLVADSSDNTTLWQQNTASGSGQALINLQNTLFVNTAANESLELRVANSPVVGAADITGPAIRISGTSVFTNSGFLGTLTLSRGLFQMNANNVLPTNNAVTLGTGTDSAIIRMNSTSAQTVAGINGNAASGLLNSSTSVLTTLTINGSGTSTFAGTVGLAGTSGSNAAISIVKTGAGTQTFSGSITNGGAVNVATSGTVAVSGGTLVLSGSNSYNGVTNINNGGTLRVGHASALGSAAAGTFLNAGGNLDLNGITGVAEALTVSGTGTLSNSSTNAASLTTDATINSNFTVDNTGDITTARLIGGITRTITKEGAGTLTTSGTNHNSLIAWTINNGTVVLANTVGRGADRGVTINSGTLRISGSNTNLIADDRAFTMNGGVFDLNGKGEAIASVDGVAGAVIRNSNATSAILYVGGGVAGSSSGTFAGIIENGNGILNVTKEGTGTQTLSGINTYSGNTTVTQAGNLTLADNGGLRFVIGANGVNNQVRGVGSVGSVTLDGDFTFDLSGAGIANGNSWLIVDSSALASVSYGSTFTVNGFSDIGGDQWQFVSGLNTWTFSESGVNAGTLQLTVVPEPGTFVMLLGGMGVLTLLRRRRE